MASSSLPAFSLLGTSDGAPPSSSSSSRASVAMFLEKHRNSLALGFVVLLAAALLAVLFAPMFADASVGSVGPTTLLEEAHVIPDVLDPFRPCLEVDLSLGSRLVLDGANLPLATAQQDPSVSFHPTGDATSPSGKYVLVVVDPDAPSPSSPTAREWLHWIVTDIDPSSTVTPSPESGTQILEYSKPTPPEGSHRYVFAVFAQPVDMPQVTAPEARANFNLRSFAKEHSLGEPLGAIYITTEPSS